TYLEQNLVSGEEVYMFAQDKTMFEQYFPHEARPGTGKPADTPSNGAGKSAAPAEKAVKAPVPAAKLAKPQAVADRPAKTPPPPPPPEKPNKPQQSQEGWG